MSDVDPLIKRELQWMALGVLENRDLTAMVFQRVRRRRIRRAILTFVTLFSLVGVSLGGYALMTREAVVEDEIAIDSGATGSTDENAINRDEIIGLRSDYPITWAQSVGDYAAISKAAGIGDTLGGLTALGLKVSWERCGENLCPTQWVLSLMNQTEDIVTIAPSISVFIDYNPLSSVTRPVTVVPGDTAILIFTFPEFADLTIRRGATWQWNWYLTSL
ncbi:MAG: hypothetical protein ACKOFU_00030 [Actinomycetota bacterium]